jgi:cyclopropane fatty-acyl-phospholipid synthase-like methyltransferase
MTFYDDPKNVQQYIDMAEGYDGRELIAALTRYLPSDAEVLELGIGPGVDLDLLSQHFRVTGSDTSQVFLNRYQAINPAADLLLLDAETIQTSRSFDCIYSNKVLHHLTPEQLQASFLRQHAVLLEGGIALHSFWLGDSEEFMHGLRFRYYPEDFLHSLVEPNFTILESTRYMEFEADDSLYLILEKAESA